MIGHEESTLVTRARLLELYHELTNCLNRVKLKVAGRFVYYDSALNTFILSMHATSPEATYNATTLAWDSIPKELKAKLQEAKIGFAGKQI